MSFQAPLLLLTLLAIPFAALLYRAHARRAERAAAAFANPALLPNLVTERPGRLRHAVHAGAGGCWCQRWAGATGWTGCDSVSPGGSSALSHSSGESGSSWPVS